MPNKITATVAIELPEDEFEEAGAKVKLKPMVDEFVQQLTTAGFKPAVTLATAPLNGRATAARATSDSFPGKRRGRPPGAVKLRGPQLHAPIPAAPLSEPAAAD